MITVSADYVDPNNEGKLVYVTGKAEPQKEVADPDMGVSVLGIALIRKVEIYQWVEEVETKRERQLGGGEKETRTYKYKKEWREEPVDSSTFHASGQARHVNRGTLPFRSRSWYAETRLGAFNLTESQLRRLGNAETLSITPAMAEKLSEEQRKVWRVREGMFYRPINPHAAIDGDPEIGDVRVSYQWIPPGPVSVVAQQINNTFTPYLAKAGDTVDLIATGYVPVEQMFAEAHQANVIRTWLVRLVGFLMMGFGLMLIFQPLAVLADVIPFLGSLVGLGIALVSFTLAFVLSLITIAIGWLYYRPLLGISLLAVAAVILLLLWSRSRKVTQQEPPTEAAHGPPQNPSQ
ncbi:MAG: TMEM43 family protein [Thermogemmata sp.]|nr:TMEM43 family protein [Thermogemmata sp.]